LVIFANLADKMKILVRLPNWLGDMVMAGGLLNALPDFYPGAAISVIAKKGIHELLSFFPAHSHQFIFEKEKYKGLYGAWRFGRAIKKEHRFDLFICLPDSLSSAVMARATGAKKRIGYKKEGRSFLFTDTYKKENGKHRVEEYVSLVEKYSNKKASEIKVQLHHSFQKKQHVIVNINSEASSRRLTVFKATELINYLRSTIKETIILIGAPKEKPFIDAVCERLHTKVNIENKAGKTSLAQLTELLATAQLLLTTDSGPAHLANALGTQTVVLFGAGNEQNTAPYNKEFRTIVRLGQLSCEPCEKNVCVRFGTPQCLEQLSSARIGETVVAGLQKKP
jgi:heptosyltransferase II